MLISECMALGVMQLPNDGTDNIWMVAPKDRRLRGESPGKRVNDMGLKARCCCRLGCISAAARHTNQSRRTQHTRQLLPCMMIQQSHDNYTAMHKQSGRGRRVPQCATVDSDGIYP
jgi:hypothetical protein